jgi:hypothetical protein
MQSDMTRSGQGCVTASERGWARAQERYQFTPERLLPDPCRGKRARAEGGTVSKWVVIRRLNVFCWGRNGVGVAQLTDRAHIRAMAIHKSSFAINKLNDDRAAVLGLPAFLGLSVVLAPIYFGL